MFLMLGTPRRLSEIHSRSWSAGSARKLVPIVIIDDEGFALSQVLRQHSYDIVEYSDVTSVTMLAAFEIVICDIKGVGKTLGGKHEGGHIIREVRRLYPEKYVVAFSGHRFDPTFKRVLDDSDASIKKDAGVEEWVDLLDRAVNSVGNPVNRWKRIRLILLNNNLEICEILKLEQAYIKAVKTGNPSALKSAIKALPDLQNISELLQIAERLVTFATRAAEIWLAH